MFDAPPAFLEGPSVFADDAPLPAGFDQPASMPSFAQSLPMTVEPVAFDPAPIPGFDAPAPLPVTAEPVASGEQPRERKRNVKSGPRSQRAGKGRLLSAIGLAAKPAPAEPVEVSEPVEVDEPTPLPIASAQPALAAPAPLAAGADVEPDEPERKREKPLKKTKTSRRRRRFGSARGSDSAGELTPELDAEQVAQFEPAPMPMSEEPEFEPAPLPMGGDALADAPSPMPDDALAFEPAPMPMADDALAFEPAPMSEAPVEFEPAPMPMAEEPMQAVAADVEPAAPKRVKAKRVRGKRSGLLSALGLTAKTTAPADAQAAPASDAPDADAVDAVETADLPALSCDTLADAEPLVMTDAPAPDAEIVVNDEPAPMPELDTESAAEPEPVEEPAAESADSDEPEQPRAERKRPSSRFGRPRRRAAVEAAGSEPEPLEPIELTPTALAPEEPMLLVSVEEPDAPEEPVLLVPVEEPDAPASPERPGPEQTSSDEPAAPVFAPVFEIPGLTDTRDEPIPARPPAFRIAEPDTEPAAPVAPAQRPQAKPGKPPRVRKPRRGKPERQVALAGSSGRRRPLLIGAGAIAALLVLVAALAGGGSAPKTPDVVEAPVPVTSTSSPQTPKPETGAPTTQASPAGTEDTRHEGVYLKIVGTRAELRPLANTNKSSRVELESAALLKLSCADTRGRVRYVNRGGAGDAKTIVFRFKQPPASEACTLTADNAAQPLLTWQHVAAQ